MHGGKYGVTRDFVLALKGFLPTGEWVEWGTATKKFSAGFNLRDLWIGSEGMLGVVTDATLKLIPRPADALDAPRLVQERDPTPSGRCSRSSPCGCSPRSASFSTGTRSTAPSARPGRSCSGARRAGRSCSSSSPAAGRGARAEGAPPRRGPRRHGLAHRAARNRAEAEALWEVRRSCSGAMFKLGDSKLNEDVVVPMGKYVAFARFLERPAQGVGPADPDLRAPGRRKPPREHHVPQGGPRGVPRRRARGQQA